MEKLTDNALSVAVDLSRPHCPRKGRQVGRRHADPLGALSNSCSSLGIPTRRPTCGGIHPGAAHGWWHSMTKSITHSNQVSELLLCARPSSDNSILAFMILIGILLSRRV